MIALSYDVAVAAEASPQSDSVRQEQALDTSQYFKEDDEKVEQYFK